MSILKITSAEALDAAVAAVVRCKIIHTTLRADRDAELVAVEKRFQGDLGKVEKQIAELEADVQSYCEAHRPELFPNRKSRETGLAVIGFELTPPRVEPASRKIKWKDVVLRLLRLSWGKAYVRTPEPTADKQALLTDREKLSPEQLTAAGIQFCQDEQFFIRPKPETAEESK